MSVLHAWHGWLVGAARRPGDDVDRARAPRERTVRFRPHRSVAAAATLLGVLFQTSVALGFRTTADLDEYGGYAARWRTTGVAFHLHEGGAPGLTLGDVESAVVQSWQRWEQPACSAVDVYNLGIQSVPAAPGDGRNTIEWVHDWTDRGLDPTAAGATDVQYERLEGEPWAIVEADIYLNAEHFSWRIGGDETEGRDLVSVLTHEMGHALGLLHPCEPDGAGSAPHCDQYPFADGTTMHPTYDPEQSTLSADDEKGICFLYPQATCETEGCSAGFTCTERGCEQLCEPACADGQRCVRGECLGEISPVVDDGGAPGRGVFSDPCRSAVDCASGVCSNGACSTECVHDSDCEGPGASCSEGACVSRLGGVGQTCSEANQCVGEQCLAIDGDPPVCTRACVADRDCPAEWSCEALEARLVCAPPGPLYPSGACSLGPPRAKSAHGSLFLASCFVAFAFLLRRPRSPRRRFARP